MGSLGELPLVNVPESIPFPSHRHAMPSGPWPWMDIGSEESNSPATKQSCDHPDCSNCSEWLDYPQSHFPNWTTEQVKRSAILIKAEQQHRCHMYYVDIKSDGMFERPNEITVINGREHELWELLHSTQRPPHLRARAVFVENITSPILRILGARYNIEPFFFSSSLNWIPSRYQEDVRHGEGDHVTVTMTFLRTTPDTSTETEMPASTIVINTQAPLALRSGGRDRTLVLDTLAIHMIRRGESSTIISYHPDHQGLATATKGLHSRVHLVGSSVYWRNIFSQSRDPTFLFLAILWNGVYAWDEALETLYSHITTLEGTVMDTNDIVITRELHVIRAHLLHYASLLEDFRKSIHFVLETKNPAMETLPENIQKRERELLTKESKILLAEIDRLQMSRASHDMRLRNVINLVFSLVNLEDSKRSQKLTEASLRDSEATKQISYLTMVFFPGIFISGIFSMNVKEMNSSSVPPMRTYMITAIIFTIITAWVVVALQIKHLLGSRMWTRFLWPFMLGKMVFLRQRKKTRDRV